MTVATYDMGIGQELLEAQGPCTAPLDSGIDYLRARMDRVLPMYLLAMAPHAVVTTMLIDMIDGEQRSRAATFCIYLTAATVWRWVWLSRLQYGIQKDLQTPTGPAFWRRIGAILLVRLYSNAALTWGSFLVLFPSFYGFFVGSFAAPLLLENDDPVFKRVRSSLVWIQFSGKRLFRVTLVLSAITILLTSAIFVSQIVLADTILPSLLGIDDADLAITLNSWAWRLRIFYFIFLVIDLFWTVAAVFVYYDSQSRRMATDLRAQLMRLAEVPV